MVFKGLTYKCRTENYDPHALPGAKTSPDQRAKIRPRERQKSQFIFEYHFYQTVTQYVEKNFIKTLKSDFCFFKGF